MQPPDTIYLTASCVTANRPATQYYLTENQHERWSVPELREAHMTLGDILKFSEVEDIAHMAPSFQKSADRQGLGEIDWSRLKVTRHVVSHTKSREDHDLTQAVQAEVERRRLMEQAR